MFPPDTKGCTSNAAMIDSTDRKILHALYVDGRVPFRRVADILGISEQTVARRYRRLSDAGTARVVGQLAADRLEQSDWALRLHVPRGAEEVAAGLARRPDTAWVELASAGSEVFCVIRAQQDPRPALDVLSDIPAARRITGIGTHRVLHLFINGSKPPVAIAGALTPGQASQLSPPPPGTSCEKPAAQLRDDDWPLIRALTQDGRATYRQLAELTHWHESTVRGRITELTDSRLLYFDLDTDTDALGLATRAVLWLSVTPDALNDAGHALAAHPEVPLVAATTGPASLMASVVCQDDHALYRYLTQQVAKIKGITNIETVPVTQTVKRHTTIGKTATGTAMPHPAART